MPTKTVEMIVRFNLEVPINANVEDLAIQIAKSNVGGLEGLTSIPVTVNEYETLDTYLA